MWIAKEFWEYYKQADSSLGASAKRWRSAGEAKAKRWLALCPLEISSSQDRDSLPPRVGLGSDAVMFNVLSSPQTPGGTAVSCYATSFPLPLAMIFFFLLAKWTKTTPLKPCQNEVEAGDQFLKKT